jgi:hypothetical protein
MIGQNYRKVKYFKLLVFGEDPSQGGKLLIYLCPSPFSLYDFSTEEEGKGRSFEDEHQATFQNSSHVYRTATYRLTPHSYPKHKKIMSVQISHNQAVNTGFLIMPSSTTLNWGAQKPHLSIYQ